MAGPVPSVGASCPNGGFSCAGPICIAIATGKGGKNGKVGKASWGALQCQFKWCSGCCTYEFQLAQEIRQPCHECAVHGHLQVKGTVKLF
jgi:hypothetical protein